jgi:hypothetical protein
LAAHTARTPLVVRSQGGGKKPQDDVIDAEYEEGN